MHNVSQSLVNVASINLTLSLFLVLAGQGYVHFEPSFRVSNMAVNSIKSPIIDGRYREDFSIRFYVSQHGAGLDTLSKLHFGVLIFLIIRWLFLIFLIIPTHWCFLPHWKQDVNWTYMDIRQTTNMLLNFLCTFSVRAVSRELLQYEQYSYIIQVLQLSKVYKKLKYLPFKW